jgi:hypothetical protein
MRKRCRSHKRTSDFHYHSRISRIRQRSNFIRIQYICRLIFAITTKTIFFDRTMLEAISKSFWAVYIHSTCDNIFSSLKTFRETFTTFNCLILKWKSTINVIIMRNIFDASVVAYTFWTLFTFCRSSRIIMRALYLKRKSSKSDLYMNIHFKNINYNRFFCRQFFKFFSFQ